MKRPIALITALALAAVLAACGTPVQPTPKSIAETAAEDGRFDTLLSILPEDLAGLLADDDAGPFTVFAPSDDAFAAIEAILPTLSEDQVREILELHVIAGAAVSSTDAIAAASAASLGGELLFFVFDGQALFVDGVAEVIAADIEASNGVIHAIDAVLLPKGTIADAVIAATEAAEPEFQTLLAAVLAADPSVLEAVTDVSAGPFTVFAPTDAAFAALPPGALDDLIANPAALTNVLLYHVASGAFLSSQVIALIGDGPVDLEMLNGDDVTVSQDGAAVKVNDATVIAVDLLTANGVIHVIDAVLLP